MTVTSSRTSVPGPADPRALGIQIDRITCAPLDGRAWEMPDEMRKPIDDIWAATAAFWRGEDFVKQTDALARG